MTRRLLLALLLTCLLPAITIAQDPQPADEPEPGAPAPAGEPADAGDPIASVTAELDGKLAELRSALVDSGPTAVWALIDDGSRAFITDQLKALQEVIGEVPADKLDVRPAGWAEGDTLATVTTATPQAYLGIWMRTDQGRVVAGDLQNLGRIASLTLSDDGNSATFALDGTAVFPPYAATRHEDGWRLRFLH